MTIQQKLGIAAVVALLALIGFGAFEWLQEHDARTKAEATAAVQQKSIDQAQSDAVQTAAQLKQTLAVLQAQAAQPATPRQLVIDASKFVPNLPQPLTVVQPPPTVQTVNGKQESVPSAPVVQIPQVDFQVLQDSAIRCQENSAKLSACTLTAADTATELKATTAQRDVYKAAMNGGSFWSRLGQTGKCLLMSGGGAAIGAATDKAHPGTGAAIGASAGTVGCSLWRW
jgi:hypothetical protein